MVVIQKNRPFRFADRNDYQLFIRSVIARDDWRCRVPGCRQRANLTVHHIVKRSLGGADTYENTLTLCFDHHRMNEDGKLKISGTADNPAFEFRGEKNDER